MDRRREELTAKLGEIEAEMRRIGFWDETAPGFAEVDDRHAIRSYLDAPSFEWWLQQMFLPNARRAVIEDSLPADSQVGEMARRQYDYHSVVEEAHGLMRLLFQFDGMIVLYAAERTRTDSGPESQAPML
ncbi:MAG: YqcC family protein [Candidatus Fermentibacter sp.]|nr:YqcC family protein [Candidatus Fermentibacter sp.]